MEQNSLNQDPKGDIDIIALKRDALDAVESGDCERIAELFKNGRSRCAGDDAQCKLIELAERNEKYLPFVRLMFNSPYNSHCIPSQDVWEDLTQYLSDEAIALK